MKNLIIHPEDSTTTFLSLIYSSLTSKTIVNGGITKPDLRELIESHDRIIILGHGSPYGLLSRGQFPDAGLNIVDESLVLSLLKKPSSIFIWCYADQFVQRHGLSGLCSGMFISEAGEAAYFGFYNLDRNLINQSNERFTSIISKYLHEPIEILFQQLLFDYELLAKTNPIARFNLERLCLHPIITGQVYQKIVF